MKKRDFLLSLLFFLIGIASRLPLVEKMHSHLDSSSYALALLNYSFQQETPAPPGYPLYFFQGKMLMYLVHDPHLAILLVSVLWSGIGGIVFFLVGRSLGNRITGIISSLLFLCAPSFYFFGLTSYPYLLSLVMTTLLVWCVHAIAFKKKDYGVTLGFLYALSLGVRPQEVITTFALFLYGLYYLSSTQKTKSLISFGFFLCLWLVPFLVFVGGPVKYLEVVTSGAQAAIPFPHPLYFLKKKFELASGFFLTLGGGVVILVVYYATFLYKIVIKKGLKLQKKNLLFLGVWIAPSILFNFFVRTEHVGYQTGYLTFFLFFIAQILSGFHKKRPAFTKVVIIFIIFTNLFLFFYNRDPEYVRPFRQTSFHYSDIVRNEYLLTQKIRAIKENYHPHETLIISGPIFWRQMRYYLPEYQIYELDGLVTDHPMLIHKRRDAKGWKYKEYIAKDNSFFIPEPVVNLVLIDDESPTWILQNRKVIQFKGMTRLTIVPVKPGDKVSYQLNVIRVSSKQ